MGSSTDNAHRDFLKEATEPKKRTWNTWVLSEEDIQEVAEQSGISLEGRDLDEIARLYEKGICEMLGNSAPDWTDILEGQCP